ncbi:MAG: chaperone modulator CbpM [Chitinophagaceae bacterium]
MEPNELIPANDFCLHNRVSYTFIATLEDAGLIQITTIEEQHFLRIDQLGDIERLSRLHTELGINPEGIEAIAHLLDRMHLMHQEMKTLRQRLALYER